MRASEAASGVGAANAERYENWRRALRLALGQEWPRLGRLRRRLRRLDTELIALSPTPDDDPKSVAAVAADGGEGRIVLEPLRIYVLRVADSDGTVYFEECIPHSLEAPEIIRFFLRSNERVRKLVAFLGIGWEDLAPRDRAGADHLLPMLRELLEWGALLRLAHGREPRLILRDGLLRSVLLPEKVFRAIQRKLEAAVGERGHWLAGVAKRSAALRYLATAFALDEAFADGRPRYARVPPEVEEEAAPGPYHWAGERAMGELYAARLEAGAPILPVDIAAVCGAAAPDILRRLAQSARASFPLRGYPAELLTAHERACFSGIEAEALQALFLDELEAFDEAAARAARTALMEGQEPLEIANS